MSKRIIKSVQAYFEQNFEVNSEQTFTTAAPTVCKEITIPAFTKDIDLYITIKAENDGTKAYFAAASQCAVSADNGRPVIGIYYLNFAGMETSKVKEYLYFSTYAHEFTHILGFT